MKKLLIATNNTGKFLEYQEIFKQLKLPIKLVSLKELRIQVKIKETGKTFKENAIKKAKFYSKLTSSPVLADDGGLEIDILGGEPGVKSHRWPGYEASDRELIKYTLEKMKNVPAKKRGAQFKVAIALSFSLKKKIYTSEGAVRGFIAQQASKKIIKDYPYRSIFRPLKSKNVLAFKKLIEAGHRVKAIKKLIPIIRKEFAY